MAVFPDDVCGLGRNSHFERLVKHKVTCLDLLGDDHCVFLLKGDESCGGSSQRFKVTEKVVDLTVHCLDTVEPLKGDVLSTFTEGLDQIAVVVGEDHVGDGHILVHLLRLRVLATIKVDITGCDATSDLILKDLLDLADHVSFQAQCWSVALFKFSTRALVDGLVPVSVGVCRNVELKSVVTGCHGRDIPLQLLNLASLEQLLEKQDKEETDQASGGRGDVKVFILGCLLSLRLDAGVLDKEEVGWVTTSLARRATVEITLAELHAVTILADGLVEEVLDAVARWLTASVLVVVDAGVERASRFLIVHTVVKDGADGAVVA